MKYIFSMRKIDKKIKSVTIRSKYYLIIIKGKYYYIVLKKIKNIEKKYQLVIKYKRIKITQQKKLDY